MTLAQAERSERKVQRCPACGHRFSPPAPMICSLCEYPLTGPPTTGMDSTPYAQAYSEGERGGWAMLKWIAFGGERVRHLALMRASSASRRYCIVNLIWLSLALTAFHVTEVGWHEADPEGSGERGNGWVTVASAPFAGGSLEHDRLPRVLWWNARIAGVAAGVSFVAALLLSGLAVVLLRTFVEAMHSTAYRGEGRMSAAMHYATAWLLPVTLAGGIILIRPLARASEIGGWSVTVPSQMVMIVAGVAASIGVVMGWFFLLRLGMTAPVKCRGRVVGCIAIGAPVLLAGMTLLWHFGLMLVYDQLMLSFGWQF